MLSSVIYTCIGSLSSFGVVEDLRCESRGSSFEEDTTSNGLGIRSQYLRKLTMCVPSVRTYQQASTELNVVTSLCM
jgi:hypothetical protein